MPPTAYLGEIESLLDFYGSTFVSRQNEFSRIGAFAARSEPGYLLIERSPGRASRPSWPSSYASTGTAGSRGRLRR